MLTVTDSKTKTEFTFVANRKADDALTGTYRVLRNGLPTTLRNLSKREADARIAEMLHTGMSVDGELETARKEQRRAR